MSNPEKPSSSSQQATGYKPLGPLELSFLEHVLSIHGSKVDKSSASFIALLVHAGLLSHGARLIDPCTNQECSVIDDQALNKCPIRLAYTLTSRPKFGQLAVQSCQLKISITETDSTVIVNLTDDSTEKIAELVVYGPEHVSLQEHGSKSQPTASRLQPNTVYPRLSDLWNLMDKELFTPVLPSPPIPAPPPPSENKPLSDPSTTRSPLIIPPSRPFRPLPGPSHPNVPFMPDIGGSDLDPMRPFSGPFGRGGGMLMDPSNPFHPGPLMGGPEGLPPGAVPPGARFDPMGPGFTPVRPRNPHHLQQPDPDHERPPEFDDMYM